MADAMGEDDAEGRLQIGLSLRQAGRLREALTHFHAAIDARPGFAAAWREWAVTQASLGAMEDALYGYREVVRLQPDDAPSWFQIGLLLRRSRAIEESLVPLRETLRINPKHAEAHNSLGNTLSDLGQRAEAETHYREAIRYHPAFPEAHNNLGIALAGRGAFAESLALYDRAIELSPNYAAAHLNRSLVRLLMGDFAGGWVDYEWRLKMTGAPARFKPPVWDGSPLAGRTILLHADQGYGDTIHLIRYAPLVKAGGGKVVVECQAPVLRLLESAAGVDRLILRGTPLPAFDVQAPLLSLPGILGTRLETIPATIPYLFPEPVLAERWQRELQPLAGIRIGIVWQGHPTHPGDRERSAPLDRFGTLAAIDGVSLVSLQVDAGREQRATFNLFDVGDRLTSFAETAAVIASLDLVITVDTAVAHLAGALGKPVWVLLPPVPDWRWLLDREDSPWYPTMRLFRRAQEEDWQAVFGRVTEALRVAIQQLKF